MSFLTGKNIIVAIGGGIAAYKSADLVRRLKEQGAEVRVVMTEAAKAFITPLSLQALSGFPVHDNLFDEEAEAAMGHIELARWADAILIAPATADLMARLAHGLANDLLSTLCLASKAKKVLIPAMNQQMWQDPATQENLCLLKSHNYLVWGPAEGLQACGDIGLGRLLEPSQILSETQHLFSQTLFAGKKVLITAGPTQEALDPVRYLSNHSSGKMGYALAQAFQEAGAQVFLISGPCQLVVPQKIKCQFIKSATDMQQAVMANIQDTDIFVAAAAVADYRPAEMAKEKIPKTCEEFNLKLIKNPDILKQVGLLAHKPFSVGFAAQTHDLIAEAKQKMQNKNCDMMIANMVGENQGFQVDDNAVSVLWQEEKKEFSLMKKTKLARELVTLIAQVYQSKERK